MLPCAALLVNTLLWCKKEELETSDARSKCLTLNEAALPQLPFPPSTKTELMALHKRHTNLIRRVSPELSLFKDTFLNNTSSVATRSAHKDDKLVAKVLLSMLKLCTFSIPNSPLRWRNHTKVVETVHSSICLYVGICLG